MSSSISFLLSASESVGLLSARDERDLAQRMAAGLAATATLAEGVSCPVRRRELQRQATDGLRARDEFIQSNIRLVVSIAKRFPVRPDLSLGDNVSNGILGLIRAVDKFDWTMGYKFSTYATNWIRQAITRGADSSTPVSVSTEALSRHRAASRAGNLVGDSETPDPKQELADDRVRNALTPLSLDMPVFTDSGTPLSDRVAPHDLSGHQVEAFERRSVVESFLGKLPGVMAEAMRVRYGIYAELDGRPELALPSVAAEMSRRLGRNVTVRTVKGWLEEAHQRLAEAASMEHVPA